VTMAHLKYADIMVKDNTNAPVGDPRVRFAAERTLLAWIRTGIAMMGFGFVVARFGWFLRELATRTSEPPSPNAWSLTIGVGLITMGVGVNVLAGIEHARFLRRFDRGEVYRAPGWSLGLALATLLAVVGIIMAAYLLALSV
jgi:putative membrane protein